jgi:hypothetical protein
MSDFPEGITAPKGAQKLVDVCKETWAVIQGGSSEVSEHDEAVDRFEAAMDELAELGVHVNNEGEHPAVFSLGVKETAYDPSVPVSGAPLALGNSCNPVPGRPANSHWYVAQLPGPGRGAPSVLGAPPSMCHLLLFLGAS